MQHHATHISTGYLSLIELCLHMIPSRERKVTEAYLNELEQAVNGDTPSSPSSTGQPGAHSFKKVEAPRLHTPSLDIIME